MPFDKAYLHLRQSYVRTPSGWNIAQVSPAGVRVHVRKAKPNEAVIIERLHELRLKDRKPGRTHGWTDPSEEVPLSERAGFVPVLVSTADSRVMEAWYTAENEWVHPQTGELLQVVSWQHKPTWYSFSKGKSV